MPGTPEQPAAQLGRALRAGNLALIRAAARDLDPLPLGVAFEVLMLTNRRERSLGRGRALAGWGASPPSTTASLSRTWPPSSRRSRASTTAPPSAFAHSTEAWD